MRTCCNTTLCNSASQIVNLPSHNNNIDGVIPPPKLWPTGTSTPNVLQSNSIVSSSDIISISSETTLEETILSVSDENNHYPTTSKKSASIMITKTVSSIGKMGVCELSV